MSDFAGRGRLRSLARMLRARIGGRPTGPSPDNAVGRTGQLSVVAVLLIGLVATGTAVLALEDGYHSTAARTMDQRTELAQRVVVSEINRYLDAVRLVAAAAGGYEPLTRDKYLAATLPLIGAKLAGATSVTFLVPVADRQVAAAQAVWRGRGTPDLVLRPAPTGRDHQFTVFTRSLDGKPPLVTGGDVSELPEPAEALALAQRTGQPAVSDTYTLLRDRDLPAAARQRSFVVAAPVRGGPRAAGGEPALLGWVTMALRGDDFLSGALREVTQGVLDVSLWATDGAGRQVQVTHLVTGRPADLRRQLDLEVAQRPWSLRTAAARGALAGTRTGVLATGVGGLLITLLLAGLILVLVTGRTRARWAVVTATAEIRRVEHEVRRQAELLSAVLDSLSDGLTVVDEDGRILVKNPEARRLLGAPEIEGFPVDWPGHAGLFRPDGRTPFPTGELPLVRAMSGASSDEVELFVRNAGRPEGALLAVSCRPLDVAAGLRGAVAVYRDITVERQHRSALAAANGELAEANSELEAFSYSVSHDLRAPLRRMDGFASILLEEHGADLPADAGLYLSRIRLSAQRMSTLIDDLLAFSRLGRQALHRKDVEPTVVARAALAQLADQYPGRDVRFTIADLPACSADPALLELVYVNLLSNAIKFTRSSDPAVIDIGSSVEAGRTVYTVADNGVGFDPRYADKLFTVFQRLHAGEDYEGTGVGLALVQRIVHRHGGHIWAACPPGRGATFFFTVAERPAAG